EAELKKLETEVKMEPRQLLTLRRLLGDIVINKSPLKPLDPATLVAFGEEKEKGIAGNPEILIDKDKKIIAMNGEFCLETGPLEYLVVSKGQNARLHETIVAVNAIPRDICTALLVCNYTYAGELGEDGKINLPKDAGIMVSIEFDYEVPHANLKPRAENPDMQERSEDPKVEFKKVRVPIEYFVWNAQTEQPMKRNPFAFTGSKFEKDENGKPIFMADLEKSIVAVKLDPYAVMNTPMDMRDVDPQHSAGYAINRHVCPPRKTKCRVVFEPWSGGELKEEDLKDTGDTKKPGTPAAATPP
ncbi:MAG TPA: YdjY domain-containing protein, partial [Planctomycetota bacterium]|nr:YdjY domain-containing protein [Planctomycetota bacterium]